MLQIVILAGGKGTRMKSDRPKVLTPVGGVPIIARLLAAVRPLAPTPVLIVGHGGDAVIEATNHTCRYIWQREQLGTGHAVRAAKEELEREEADPIVVLPGDHPLISTATVEQLIATHRATSPTVTLTTAVVPAYEGEWKNYEHYGRILRDADGAIAGIREFKDATPVERAMPEVNVGYYCFDAAWLWANIERLGSANASGEFYLTDMVGLAVTEGRPVGTFTITDPTQGMGVNTPEDLATAEARVR